MLQEYTQAMKELMADKIRDIHTVIPGEIVSFDPDKCEASIQPLAKYKKPNGDMMDFPQLNEVPIFFLQSAGQTATLVYPIKKDDECLIFVSEQTLNTWRTGAESNIDLRFDLSNAIALVGLFVKPNPLVKEACDDDALIIEKDGERVRLKKGETYIRDTNDQSITLTPNAVTVIAKNAVVNASGDATVKADGKMEVESGESMTLKAGGNFTLNAANATVNAAGQWVTQAGINSGTHTHTGVQSGPGTTGPPV